MPVVVSPVAGTSKALAGQWKVVRVEKGKETDASWARICRFSRPALDPATTSRLNLNLLTPNRESMFSIRRLDPYPNLPYELVHSPADPLLCSVVSLISGSLQVFFYRIDPAATPRRRIDSV